MKYSEEGAFQDISFFIETAKFALQEGDNEKYVTYLIRAKTALKTAETKVNKQFEPFEE